VEAGIRRLLLSAELTASRPKERQQLIDEHEEMYKKYREWQF